MTNIETYKSKLTRESAEVFDHYEKTGEDDAYYFGQIARGIVKAPNLGTILQYAQVFANPDLRGRVGSPKSYTSQNIAVVSGAISGDIKGLVNNGFTSSIVADKTLGLSNLRETYASNSKMPFYMSSVNADISDVEQKLNEIASSIMLSTRKNSFSKKMVGTPLKLTKLVSKNSLCVLADEIYQVASNKIEEEFDSQLEKATASIFATLLVSRALDLSIGDENNLVEKKFDESLKLQFYTHLNACFNAGKCAISKIVKSGAACAVSMIEEMGYSQSDIMDKYDRLETPIKGNPHDIFDALFGSKNVSQSIESFVDEDVDLNIKSYKDGLNGVVVEDDTTSKDVIYLGGRVQPSEVVVAPAAIAGAPSRILITDGKTNVTLNPGEQVAGANEKIAKEGEQVAKTTEKVVDKDARVAESGEVVHDKGNAVNYNTLKKSLLGSIVAGIDERIAECTNRAEKQPKSDASAEANFWSGAKDGVCGLAKKRGKTESYYEGHKQGQYVNAGIIQEIDKMYSVDKKKLNVEVKGQGREATKKLGDQVANAFSFDTFMEFSAMIMSSLSEAFKNLKSQSSKSSRDDQSK